jgi:glycosyltransferase involved in cell wall biosynthesis
MKSLTPEISILLPCLNEELALPHCIDEIEYIIKRYHLEAEVIIIDNGSTDRSKEIVIERAAKNPSIRLISETSTGYGSAYLTGFANSSGYYIFMADSDGTYDFKDIPLFIRKLKEGADLVVGNRFTNKMEKGVMPWHHKYIGNPFLSFLVKKLFSVKLNDIHCGVRAIKRDKFNEIKLYTRGMEFASEMIIQASRKNLKMVEVPVRYRARIGLSKLRSFIDGWRNLRFILLYSPLFLFMLPGIILFSIGIISMICLYFFHIELFSIRLYVHPLFYSSLAMILGYQLIVFAGFSKIYAVTHLGDNNSTIIKSFKYLNIEKGLIAGLALLALGGFMYLYVFIEWINFRDGQFDQIKNSIVALTLLILGIQTFFSSFMFSIIGIKERN